VPAHFLNADLDIFSDQSLQPLITEIGDRAFLLGGGPHSEDIPFYARYEIDNDPETKTPETLIVAFCNIVESLSSDSRSLWDSARERVIDLGYDVWPERTRTEDRISSATLHRMAILGIHLAWTFYPSDDTDSPTPEP
jgi:hypothetical protein